MKKTAAEWVPAHYVKTERSSTPEPRFRQSWSRLRKLRWLASLIMSEHPGVRLYVEKGRGLSGGRFIYGQFSISFNNGGMSAVDYGRAWDILTGIELGLDIAGRLPASKEPTDG